MKKPEQFFACEKIITSLGVSTCHIKNDEAITEKEMEWAFIIPPGTKLTADINPAGGTVTFSLPLSSD